MNDRSFHLRFATPEDAGQIYLLVRELAEFERLEHACVATLPMIERALFGPDPAAEVIIAQETGNTRAIAGFALFFHTFSTFLGRRGLWLEDLFVRPPYRGRGVGRGLMEELARIARDRDCGRFEWSVLDWNRRAITFYERLGAVVMTDWRIARVAGPALEALASRPPPSG